jgi:PAS domain S-box-containing protein
MEKKSLLKDDRLSKILVQINKFKEGAFDYQEVISGEDDEIDAVISNLNDLGKVRGDIVKQRAEDQKRMEILVEGLLKYTLFDFSEKIEVTEKGDEIDAVAIGLNTLTEELEHSIASEKLKMEALEESNNQIEVILENAPNAVIVLDEQGEVVRWNKKSELIFGWKAEEVMNQPMHLFIMPPVHTDAHYAGISHFLKTGEGPVINKTIEITAIRKSKEEFPIELSISAVKAKGKYLFVAFISDISKRKQNEEQIKTSNINLENSVKELEAFTYSVSHDLRAPLRAIHGYTTILYKNYFGSFDDKGKKMMNSVMANSKKMGQLIDDLLGLSRLGRSELQRKQVSMNSIVETVVQELSVFPSGKKPQFIIQPLPTAFADANLMAQVYTNLISNAIKYSSLKEQPVIEIGSMQENTETVFYVRDNGSGFDMQFYNKLFGVFQRLHDSSKFEGNGIGLSIVKQIILKHEGRVWATSELEKGSTFYFTVEKKSHHE